MKLLLDQGTPRSAAGLLRQSGFDAVHTGEIRMAGSADEEILKSAADEQRVIITLDADFHQLLALSQTQIPSVVRIRIEGLRAEAFFKLVVNVIQQCEADLKTGALVSVTDFKIRVRHLPIV